MPSAPPPWRLLLRPALGPSLPRGSERVPWAAAPRRRSRSRPRGLGLVGGLEDAEELAEVPDAHREHVEPGADLARRRRWSGALKVLRGLLGRFTGV